MTFLKDQSMRSVLCNFKEKDDFMVTITPSHGGIFSGRQRSSRYSFAYVAAYATITLSLDHREREKTRRRNGVSTSTLQSK